MSSDDIVIRLRSKYGGQLPICNEAADEIERLREQNDHLKANVEMLLAEAREVRGE